MKLQQSPTSKSITLSPVNHIVVRQALWVGLALMVVGLVVTVLLPTINLGKRRGSW